MYSFVDALTHNRPQTALFQILLLEDDPVDCELIVKILTNSDLEIVLTRTSGSQNFLECL